MAPALSIAPREPHSHDPTVLEDTDKPLSHPRRALASVDNLASHMEEDDMGLRSQPSLAKDSQEMEQILVDLGNTDLVPADLLQAIKTLETGDTLSTGDADAIFPLSGFELAENVDSEGDAVEDRIKAVQVRLERRCAFLQRRLRILQARTIGKRISEEVSQTFDKCTCAARKDGGGRHMGLKTFLKTIETTSTLQANAASKTVVGPTYYNPGTSKGDVSRSATIGVPSGTLTGLEDTAGALRSHLSAVKHELDSDATASSSGAESNDEAVTYNNPHQQHMPIEKRALWTWQRARASIASRWCWLQAQVQELEYKIRQHNDLHKQVREAKGPVEFEGEPVGYQGSLPGDEIPDDPAFETCARVRPLRRETFRKRKLLQMHNLHIATNKAAKPSDISCSCVHPEESCPVCTGRAEPMQPAPPRCTLPAQLRIARADPGYHPVLSRIQDMSPSLHISSLSGRGWFRARHTAPRAPRACPAPSAAGAHGAHAAHASVSHVSRPARRSLPTRLKRGRPPLSRKVAEREKDEDTSKTGHERSRPRGSTESRGWRRASYDIDNIVIPQSVAAATRPQILTYKEIVTPKWRVLEIPDTPMNNGVSKHNRISLDSEEEDASEGAVQRRHERAEARERAKYMRRAARRQQQQQLQQQQQQQQEQQQQQQQQELGPPPPPPPRVSDAVHETVRPYTPRQFPLAEHAYQDMLSAMPDGYRPSSTTPTLLEEETDTTSTMSPTSPPEAFADDPDDAEWDPTVEKVDRRKSFR